MAPVTLARRVAWNTVAQSSARILTLGLSLLTTVLVTRHLGVDGYGVFITVTVYTTFFAVFFDLGVSQYVARELASGAASRTLFAEALGLRAAIAFPITLLAFAIGLVLYRGSGDASIREGIAIALPLIFFATLGSVPTALFQARLMMDRVALAEICGQGVAAAAIVVAVTTDRGVDAIVACTVLGAVAAVAVLVAFARRIVSLIPSFDVAAWSRLLRESLPLGLAVMVATIYFRADAILLSLLKGPDAVGIYGIAYRVLEAMIAFPGFFVISVFPLLARSAREGDAVGFRAVSQRAFDVLVLIAIPVVAGTIALAPEIIRILTGSGFGDAVTPLRIVIVGGGLMFVNTLFAYMLIALDRQVSVLWASIAVLGFNLVLNLVLIPRYSYNAAAAVATASEVLSSVAFAWLVLRAADFVPRIGNAVKAMAAGVAMFLAIWWVDAEFVVGGLIGLAVYAAVLVLLRAHQTLELRQLLGGPRR